jgi:predicted anti-sigma-YlaC factor YlaD
MSGHLSDEQWAAAVLDESGEAVANHLRECAACREEVSSFTDAIGGARARIRKAAEQPESFWREQREGITTRLADRVFHQPWMRFVWVTATVTLVLLATTLLSRHAAPPLPKTQADPDDALMLSVQKSIRSDLPQALEPAALLAQEVDYAAETRGNP